MGKKMEFPSANSKISTSLHEENINTPDNLDMYTFNLLLYILCSNVWQNSSYLIKMFIN